MNVSKYSISIIKFIFTSILIILFGCSISYVSAEEIQENEKNEKKEIVNEEEFNENKLYIESYILDIKENLAKIDEVIKEMKSQKEYEKYPAIRLNLQTPFLGISAVVENKLIIKENISIFEASKKYSIRTIVNKRKFKIPSFSIGDIVLLTEEIDLDDENLSLENQNLVLNSLNIYLKKTQETLDFVNNQKNNLFKEYISKDIVKKVEELRVSIENVKKIITEEDNKLLFIYLQSEDMEVYEELNSKYVELYDRCIQNLEKLNNILITNDELEKVKSDIEVLLKDCDKYLEKLNYIYDSYKLNVSYYKHLTSINNELKNEIEFIEKLISTSKISEKVNIYGEEKNTQETLDYQTTIIFEIKREDLFDKLKEFNKKIQSEIDKLENVKKQNEEQNNLPKAYTNEETLKMTENIQNEYVSIFNSCIKNFYINNYENIIKDCSNKIEKISKYTDVSVAKYMKNVYFDIPQDMENIQKYSLGFVIYSNKFLDKIKTNIYSLSKYNTLLNKIYDEKINNSKILS